MFPRCIIAAAAKFQSLDFILFNYISPYHPKLLKPQEKVIDQ